MDIAQLKVGYIVEYNYEDKSFIGIIQTLPDAAGGIKVLVGDQPESLRYVYPIAIVRVIPPGCAPVKTITEGVTDGMALAELQANKQVCENCGEHHELPGPDNCLNCGEPLTAANKPGATHIDVESTPICEGTPDADATVSTLNSQPTMLSTLLPLLRKGDTLGLSIAMEGDNLYRVNILPKFFTLDGDKGSDRQALNTPLCITGTMEDLDSPEFVETITRFSQSATTLRHTIDEVETEHKTAAAAKTEKKKVAVTQSPKPAAKPASKPASKPPAKPAPREVKKAGWKDRVKTKVTARQAETKPAEKAAAAKEEPVATESTPVQSPRNAAEATQSLI